MWRSGLHRGPALHFQMGEREALQVPFRRLGGKVLFQRRLDIANAGLLSLDEVRVVAVHPPRELSELGAKRLANLCGEPGGRLQDRARQILQRLKPLRRDHRLNGGLGEHLLPILMPIFSAASNVDGK